MKVKFLLLLFSVLFLSSCSDDDGNVMSDEAHTYIQGGI